MKKICLFIIVIFLLFINGMTLVNAKEIDVKKLETQVKTSNKLGLEKYENNYELNFVPVYDVYNLSKDLKKGDIIYEAAGGSGVTHHIAIVEDIVFSSEYDVQYIRIIEAIDPKVCYSLFDDYRYDIASSTILRYKEEFTEEQLNKIFYFLKHQIGKKYSVFDGGNPNVDINSSGWYCSSLIYAAYLYAGIDLYPNNKWHITPGDLYNSEQLYIVQMSKHSCDFSWHQYMANYYHNSHCITCGKTFANNHTYIYYKNYKECKFCGYRIYEGGLEQICYTKKSTNF